MSHQTLDFYFPFIILFYGALITLILHSSFFLSLAEEKLNQEVLSQMKGHRVLGLICLWLGAFWSLQNIWFNNLDPMF